MTFESQEFFEQANALCRQKPHWRSEKEHPINQYVPVSERPFKSSEEENKMFGEQPGLSIREEKLQSIAGRDRSKMLLAGTLALQRRVASPEERIKQRMGFVTAARVPDVFEDKKARAISHYNQIDPKTGVRKII